ncbi:MAG: diguanylate cyclase, partial [Firmicutes bacterium]|nr:diguanylate cyclase [Bacillota bacterium]
MKRSLFFLVFAGAVSISLLSLSFLVYDLFSLNREVAKIPGQFSKTVDISKIELDLVTREKALQTYLLTGEGKHLEEFLSISGRINDSLGRLANEVREDRKPLVNSIREANERYVLFIDEQVVPPAREGRLSEARSRYAGEFSARQEEIFPVVEDLKAMRLTDTYSLAGALFAFFHKTTGETVLFAFVLLVSTSVAVFTLVRKSVYDNLIFRLVVAHSHNAVITFDAKGQINSFNLVAEDVFGILSKDVIGKNYKEVFTGGEGVSGVPLALPVEEVLSSGKGVCSEEKSFTEPRGWVTNLLIDCFPLRHGRRTVGAVVIARDISHRKIIEEKLRSAVVRDGLTNLYNHKYLKERLEMEVAAAAKNGAPLSLLLIDIDNFKHCNDNHGHLYGDQILKIFANILTAAVRNSDIVGRYGGDEFSVILPGEDVQSAREIAERIRKAVQNYDFPKREYLPAGRLTVSIGIAVFPDNTKNAYDLIKLADEALYEAKRSTKNKVEIYFSALKEFQRELEGSEQSVIETAKALLTVINAKDRYTYSHSEQVVY